MHSRTPLPLVILPFLFLVVVHNVHGKSLSLAFKSGGDNNSKDQRTPEITGVQTDIFVDRIRGIRNINDSAKERAKRYAPQMKRIFKFLLSEDMDEQRSSNPDPAKERQIIGPILIRLG